MILTFVSPAACGGLKEIGMAIAYHITLSCYGFWLPNDPRGSWSNYVFAPRLRQFGSATKVDVNRSVARSRHDLAKRFAAKQKLKFPPVTFNGIQARAVSRGFAVVVEEAKLRVFACAIMPDHVHLVIAKHQRENRKLISHLKAKATMQLNLENLNPTEGTHTPWAEGHWEVYLDTEDEVFHAVEYVNNNPIREGYKPQKWQFVEPLW